MYSCLRLPDFCWGGGWASSYPISELNKSVAGPTGEEQKPAAPRGGDMLASWLG